MSLLFNTPIKRKGNKEMMDSLKKTKILIRSIEHFKQVQKYLFSLDPDICWGDDQQRTIRGHSAYAILIPNSGKMITTNSSTFFKNCPNKPMSIEDKVLVDSVEPMLKGSGSVTERVGYDVALSAKYADKAALCRTERMPFDLTFGEFQDLVEQDVCDYSGKLFPHIREVTLERVDPNIGYTTANTLAVSSEMNMLKNRIFDRPLAAYPSKPVNELLLQSLEIYSAMAIKLGISLAVDTEGFIREEEEDDYVEEAPSPSGVVLGDTVILKKQTRVSEETNYLGELTVAGMALLANGEVSYSLKTWGNLQKKFRREDFDIVVKLEK